MKFVKFKSKTKTEKAKCPDEWNDVPFKNYADFLKLTEEGDGVPNPKEVFKLFFGLTDEMVNSDFRVEQLIAMNEQLNFISEAPKHTVKATHFKKPDGLFVKIPSRVEYLSLGKYRDIVETASEVLQDDEPSIVNMISLYPEMIAIFCMDKDDYSQDDLDELSEIIAQCPTPDVVELGNFFFQEFANLKRGTFHKWWHHLKMMIMTRRSDNYLKILGIC